MLHPPYPRRFVQTTKGQGRRSSEPGSSTCSRHTGKMPLEPTSPEDGFGGTQMSAGADAGTASGRSVYAELALDESESRSTAATPVRATATNGVVYARIANRGDPLSANRTKVLTRDRNAWDASIDVGAGDGIHRSGCNSLVEDEFCASHVDADDDDIEL